MRTAVPLDPSASVGPVVLRARDRDGLARWYQASLGLSVLAESDRTTVLGTAGGRPLLAIVADPGAAPAPRRQPGLYHVAFLLPSRADLGRFLGHATASGLRLQGASDHLVSEAVYLADPEGNGIEVYRDRPRNEWPRRNGRVHMDNSPFDLAGIVGEAGAARAYAGIPEGTVVGHVHLKVSDVAAARAFYEGLVGFEVTEEGYPQALFVAAGGYHHHLGLNAWESAGGTRTPGVTGLEAVAVTLPRGGAATLADRLDAGGVRVEHRGGHPSVLDPSGNRLVFLEAPVDPAAALALAEAD